MLTNMKDYFYSDETKSYAFRIKQLKKLRTIIINYENDIIKALELDLGRHGFETYAAEIGGVLSSITYMTKHLKKWMKTKRVKTPIHQFLSKSYIKPEPYGVVLIIGPFNYPFNLCIEPLIGAIAAGNCVVVKPSEQTPNVAKVITNMLRENFEKSYINVVNGGRETITDLIHTPFDYIFFTGSVPVGKIIMKAASENLVPVTLELGGKSPCIVDKEANVKIAAMRIAWGKFFNTGQTCVAPDYLFVHTDIKETFIKEFKRIIKTFYGERIHESKDFGRIVNLKHTKRLVSIINKDKDKIIYGGGYDIDSKYIEPTLIDEVTWDDECMKDEIFGPILPIMEYSNLDTVIKMINNRPKPLALYVFSENKKIQSKILNKTSSGGSCVNDTVSHFTSHYLPFGGVGNSGIGAYHGKSSFITFSHMKSILNKSTKINMKMAFPPYTDTNLKLIKKILK
ncbi:aldehyde dehydrogenase [Clostridiaceae bacterium M8S5]|nr:aldehyde dehydrogenase [Clostridiaceae bacterium M8S5]